MIDRREFLKYSAYIAVAIQTSLIAPRSLAATTPKVINGVSGNIVAACYNLMKEGPFSNETHQTVLSNLDLVTGDVMQIPIEMEKAHDVLKINDNYLVISNGGKPKLRVSDFSGRGQDIELDKNLMFAGHGFHDKENDVIIVSVNDLDKNSQGCFALLDPKDFKLMELKYLEGSAPHDIQLFDNDTFAVCNYNGYKDKEANEPGFTMGVTNEHSEIALYDRKTFKLKKTMPAYKNAMVSHSIMTDNGELFAIGFQEYDDPDIATWDNEYIEDKFRSYFAENHPELSNQWPEIAQKAKIHRVEKSVENFGLPLLPLQMSVGGTNELNVLHLENFHHRRAQSICYVRDTNTVCMSFPNSDSIALFNATTNEYRSITGAELNLKEMRGISEIEGTPYLAIAGIRRGISIVDTRNLKIVNNYDVSMGRIIHMHHIA